MEKAKIAECGSETIIKYNKEKMKGGGKKESDDEDDDKTKIKT